MRCASKKSVCCVQDSRPVCKYGAKCYQKSPDHLREYSHHSHSDSSPRKASPAGASTSKVSIHAKHLVLHCWQLGSTNISINLIHVKMNMILAQNLSLIGKE